MKAGVVTFQSANNYGAVLQAYALQEYLSDHFAETSIINYHNANIDKSYKKPSLEDIVKQPKGYLFRTIQYYLYRGKFNKIEEFRRKHLNLTKIYSEDTVKDALHEADIFITGSDQVWNYLIIGRDPSYFLEFAKSKKTCSYAASFGVSDIPIEYQAFYKESLQYIDYISVRENQGKHIVEELKSGRVDVLPDPTLLLPLSEWNKIKKPPKYFGRYILVYKITASENLLKFAKLISRKTKLPIIYIPNDLKSGIVGTVKLNVGPEEWLGYIDNAEYVITNSFHGTVFSILFRKRFFCEVSTKVNPSTSRLKTLLELFDLEDRIIGNYRDELLNIELDETTITNVLKKQISNAHDFLAEVFSDIAKPERIPMRGGYKTEAYIGFHIDKRIRMSSRSGGAFIALATAFLNYTHGAVYGAGFGEGLEVKHLRITSTEKLQNLSGAKYVQSNMQEALVLLLEDLKNKKDFLFSGTPCQVAAIKKLIPNDYSGIVLLIDIVCHSVGSPSVYQKFLKQYNNDILDFEFRNKKDFGWRENISTIRLKRRRVDTLAYNNIFYNTANMRPSCYKCPWKSNRPGDITIGDCWGIESIAPEIDDNQGISVVLANTPNGNCWVEKGAYFLSLKKVSVGRVTCQHALIEPLPCPKDREKFWEDYRNLQMKDFVKKYGKMTIKKKLRIVASRLKQSATSAMYH